MPQQGLFITCRYCGGWKRNRGRWLCGRCYSKPAIREAFPARTQKNYTVPCCSRMPHDEPTGHLPGTPEKIEVLGRRVMLGLQLWHPDDAVLEPDDCEPDMVVECREEELAWS